MKKYNLALTLLLVLIVGSAICLFFFTDTFNHISNNLNANVISANDSSENLTPEGIKRTVIKSASEYDYPPFSIVDENGDADGFSVELLEAVLNASDLDVNFYTGPWSEIKTDLADGRIQVLPLVGRTPEREAIYDFSVPYITLYGGIFVRRDSVGITELSDLKGKAVLVMKGDNSEEFVKRINLSDKIVSTSTYEEAFRLLSEGHYDAIVAQSMMGSTLLKELNITNVFLIAKISEFRQDFAFAVKKGDRELLFKLNDGLSKIISEGTFDRIHEKWFDESSQELTPIEIIPEDDAARVELIREYDRQLTSASKNYIRTGDEYWKDDYDTAKLNLDNLINQLEIEAYNKKDGYLIELFDRFEDYNTKLLEKELAAQELVREGKNQQALAIINGAEYLEYKKGYADIIDEYARYFYNFPSSHDTGQINMLLLKSQVDQYADKIDDRFDVLSKIPDPAEFMLMVIRNSLHEDVTDFEKKFGIINNAWRTNISYYNKTFGTDDVTGVMIYSGYDLTDDKKRMMLALSRDLKTYAISTDKIFINRYATFENGVDSMYPNEWIFQTPHDDAFKEDLWYYLVNPENNPERVSRWTPVYYDSVLGYWMVSLITPIYDGEEFIGTTAGDIPINDVSSQIFDYEYDGAGYSFIFDDEKNILVHPEYVAEINKRGEMEELFSFKDIEEEGLSEAISRINPSNDIEGIHSFVDHDTEHVLIFHKLKHIDWYYGFVIESAYIDRDTVSGFEKGDRTINSEMENSILLKTKQARSLFYELENDNIGKMKSLLDNFMKQDDYKTVFLENDRTKLYEKSLDLFNNNKEKYHITHFYYIYPNSTTFLRVHAPEQYGDSINRMTFQNSEKSGSWGTGIELGRTAFALRVIHPFYYNSSMIGYVEFAEEIDNYIRQLKQETKLDYGIIVKKDHINKSDWANVRKTKNLRDNYDDIQNYLIIDSTGSELLFNELCFTQERLDAVTDEGAILGQCKIGQKTYITSGFTLYDANNSAVGAVVLIHDVSEFVKEPSDVGRPATFPIETLLYLFIAFLILLGAALYILDRLKIIKIKKDVSLILMSIAIFIIIILFVFNGYTLTRGTMQNAVDTSSEKINSIADLKQEQLELYLEEQKEKIEFAAVQKNVTDEELIDMLGLQNDFDEIFILDDTGTIVKSTNVEHLGLDRSNDSYFINRRTKIYVKPAYLSDVTGVETITISTPYNSGVLVARLNVNGFNELASNREGLGETGEIYLAYRNPDGDAAIISKRLFDNKTGVIISKDDKELPITKALLKDEGLFTDIKDYRNVSVIAATRYIAEADIGMVVQIDRTEALSSAYTMNNQIWFFSSGIILAVFIVGIVFNILLTRSLRKEIDEKTKELAAHVEDLKKTKTAILNMMDDLNEVNQHLKELDEAKTNFLNVASHELKTPLTAISAYLDVLDDYKGQFSKEQVEGLEAIKRNSNQLKNLINNILEISRIESGRFEMNISEIDVKKKILLVVENLKILEHPNVELKAEVPDALPKIMFDDMRLEEILNNLISNAIKFTNKGSIIVKAALEKGNFISIRIIDTGVGIPKEKINKLFQNFYQVDSSISRKYGGTGLGLALTKKIVEHSGGSIAVESVFGKGTTFTVLLPIRQKKPKDVKKS